MKKSLSADGKYYDSWSTNNVNQILGNLSFTFQNSANERFIKLTSILNSLEVSEYQDQLLNVLESDEMACSCPTEAISLFPREQMWGEREAASADVPEISGAGHLSVRRRGDHARRQLDESWVKGGSDNAIVG